MPPMRKMKQISKVLCLSMTLAGCATVQPAGPVSDEQVEGDESGHTRSKWLAIGGALLLGAVMTLEAKDGVSDAVKDAVESANSDQ